MAAEKVILSFKHVIYLARLAPEFDLLKQKQKRTFIIFIIACLPISNEFGELIDTQ